MTGTISFGGIGSGLDTEGIVTGLVSASSGNLNALEARASNTEAAIATLSSIASKLSSLSTAADALSTVREASAYTATSSSAAVVTSISGTAYPGTFDLDVVSLAKEQRTYSKSFASNTSALGQTGSITLGVGTESAIVDIETTDTLESIATKINAAGLRASASVFYDGSEYRLQVRGLDTGSANALTFTETGTDFDLNGDGTDPAGGKTYQSATDAQVVVDGYTITRPTNQLSGVIPGLTLALTAETTETATISIASDPEELTKNIQSVVDAFNGVVSAIHLAAGFGSVKATNEELSGDYALRSVNDRLAGIVYSSSGGSGSFSMLAEIGLSLKSTGTLSLDASKLSTAISSDAAGVSELLASKMSELNELVESMSDSESGVLGLRQESLSSQSKNLADRVEREEARLDRYAEALRKQFTQMDAALGPQLNNIEQLLSIFE